MAPGKLPPPPGQPGFGHEEETEAVSANDAALQRGSHFPARHRPLGSLQGEAPGEARRALRAAGRSCGVFFWGGWERRVAPHGLLVARTERREKVVGEGIRPVASPGWPRCPGTAADCEIGKMRDFGCFGGQPGGCWALGSRGFPDEKWSSCRNFQGSVRR